jgi:regulator of protease activity HflC (stomatin/prohibitin superfamily)
MILDRMLNFIMVMAWALLGLYVTGYIISVALRDGIFAGIRAVLSRRLLFVVLCVVMPLTMLSESLVFIEPQEVGVVVSLLTPEGYRDRPFRSGLRWIAPLMEQIHLYPIYWQTYTMSSKPMEGPNVGDDSIVARTSDGQEVALDCSVIFVIDPEQAIRVHIDWQGRYIEEFVRPVLRGLVRTQVSQYTVDEVNSSKRLDLERDLSEQARAILEDRGFVMDRFVLRNISFSPEYAASVELKQVAQQNAIQKEHQAEQVRKLAAGEADRIKMLADAEADAIRVKAGAEAEALRLISESLRGNPDLLTFRYVDKLSPGIRVMLVPNDAPYLLPLPTLEVGGETGSEFESVPAPLSTPSPGPALETSPEITNTASVTTTATSIIP